MKPGFTIEQIRSFLAVADHQHVSRAAAELHLTQGAVTQQLRNFERAVGMRLLERTGRGVRLTDAGRSLTTTCRAALRAFEVIGESAQAIKSLAVGSLHVGASPTCASHFLPPLLAAFERRHPQVMLRVTIDPTAKINEGVSAGVLDCGVIEGHAAEGLTNIKLGTDELVLVARPDHPLARTTRPTGTQLGEYRYLGRGPGFAAESIAREMIGDGYDVADSLNLGHPEYVRAAAIAGLGYAALSLLAVRSDLEAGTLRRLNWPARERAIQAVRRRAEGAPTLEAFWRFLRESVERPAQAGPPRAR